MAAQAGLAAVRLSAALAKRLERLAARHLAAQAAELEAWALAAGRLVCRPIYMKQFLQPMQLALLAQQPAAQELEAERVVAQVLAAAEQAVAAVVPVV